MTDYYPSRVAAQPRMLPRDYPVVHSAWDSSAPLSAGQTAQFDRDGYLVLEDVFSSGEIDFLQREMSSILADPARLDAETVISEPDGKEIRSVFAIHDQNRLMARLAADERLAGVARFLLGDEVYVHQSRLNYKPGFFGKEFFWHSDFETWHVEDGMPNMRALSMSVLLAENTVNNGPLMLIPGSHRIFVSCIGGTPEDHYRMSLKRQEFGIPDELTLAELAADKGIVAPTGKPGTVVIFDCNTMHGSNGNITPFPRANAFFVYNAVSNKVTAPFGADRPRPRFVAAQDANPIAPVRGDLRGEMAI
ncbi:ectoine hydroxylase [Novosphingobium sp. ZN18A2]|uniref:ectoine hydroxylase n=1 Tax=Novosphingobium sp. ZN18A2 TaxID=3079861 RepID=UPI0030D5FC5E